MRTAFSAAFAAAVVVAAGPVAAGSDGRIGVYGDLTATQTSATFSIGVARTLYVVGHLEGRTAAGMTAAELRVTGIPVDWLVFVSPNPAANVTIGDPVRRGTDGVHRAIIAFPGCQPGIDGRLLLYTAVVVATSVVPPGAITVEGGDPPSNPNYPGPVFTLCDAPEFTKVAAQGESFQFDVRAPQDLDYSQTAGYDGVRGVQPQQGLPGDVFHFRVVYSNASGSPPAAGSPRLELDANGDGDPNDAGEGAFTMSSADLDSTFANGKAYRHDVALGEPPGGRYRYRFTAIDHNGAPVPGVATVWRDSLFVGAGLVDLEVRAEDIRVDPRDPRTTDTAAIFVPVRNRSDRRVENVVVRIENAFGATIAERTLAALGPRSTTEVACTWRFVDFGAQPVVARLDPGDAIAETDESDNVASHTVYVGGSNVTGDFAIGLPLLVTVPPVAPFGLAASATYVGGGAAGSPVRGARVLYVPSWQAPQETRSDADGAFRAEVTPPAVPGPYRLSVVVQDGALTDSAIVNVQVTPLPGQAPPHGPNLAVQLAATLDVGCPAATASILWSVENRGDRDSEPTTVRLLADGVTTVAEPAVDAIAPGATVVLAGLQVPVAGAGLRAFTAHVDPGNARRELRRDDNVATASVPVPVDCLDLSLSRLQFTSTRLCTGEAVAFSARVENRGCVASAAARVACRSGAQELASAPLPDLEPGQFVDIPFARMFAAGCVDLQLVVDPEGAAGADCDESGDDLAASLCPQPCGPPPPVQPPNFSVVPCDVAVSNARPAPGEELRFQAWIANSGPGNAVAPATVVFRLDGVVLGMGVSVGPLAAGQRVLVPAPVTWPADFAAHVLRVQVSANGEEELQTFDNVADRPLPWDLRPRPLGNCPPSMPSMFSTCNVCANVPLDIRAVVVNDGLFDCDSVRVDFRDDNGGIVLGSAVAHDVQAGSDCAPPAPVAITTALSPPGFHPITVVVDPENAWDEADEADNTFTQTATVTMCVLAPDLFAAIRVPGPVPQPGDTVRAVEVRVTNSGNAAAADVRARLQLDGMILCHLAMGDLDAGGTSLVVCTTPWVVSESVCSQRLEACADPNDLIPESNETNNCTTTTIGACETDLALFPDVIRITPPNPVAFQPVTIEVGLYSLRGVESTCLLIAEWSLDGLDWQGFGFVPLGIPAGVFFIPAAATIVWAPPVVPLQLRFSLVAVSPPDAQPNNNVAFGTLPWFAAPGTPVVVTDLVAESTPDGVRVRWRAEPGVAYFAFDRRRDGDPAWQRLPETIPEAAGAGSHDYEFVDRTAEPGARLEYRLVGRLPDGGEVVLGTLSVVHDAAAVVALQLHPVRPQPFRPGGAFEFSLPRSSTVDLSVFDAAGRRVVSLRRGHQTAGRHVVTWDGRDGSGRRVPAGVYFCRLAADAFQQTRRVVLVH